MAYAYIPFVYSNMYLPPCYPMSAFTDLARAQREAIEMHNNEDLVGDPNRGEWVFCERVKGELPNRWELREPTEETSRGYWILAVVAQVPLVVHRSGYGGIE